MTDLAPPSDAAVRRSRPLILAALTVGLLLGATATYYLTAGNGVPDVVQGTITGIATDSTDGDVQAVAFRFDGRHYVGPGDGESLPVVADVPWTDAAGEGHQGDRPACLAAGTTGQRVELAVLQVRGEGSWSRELVVWVHCLT
jgi:hypothetical protein